MRFSMYSYLEEASEKYPKKTFIVDGDHSVTFGYFHSCVRRLIRLIPSTVGPGDVVAVLAPNGVSMLAADFAVVGAGGAYMNVDIDLPANRIAALLNQAKPSAILVARDAEALVNVSFAGPSVTFDWADAMEESNSSSATAWTKTIDTDPACLIPTSGTTGVPKAVALTHRGMCDFIEWFDSRFDFAGPQVVGSLSPLFFDGYIPGLFMALKYGWKFIILDRRIAIFPIKLVQALSINKVSFVFWVPSTLVPIANLGLLDNASLPDLKFVGFAGEVMPSTSLKYLQARLENARFVNFYGPIEISVICTYYEVPDEFDELQPIPIGVECDNTRVLILDESRVPTAVGELGEIYVTGTCLAIGYWNDDEKTRNSFVYLNVGNGPPQRFYATGDIGRRDEDGVIHFVGRGDLQIKHQGYRIGLGEIEHYVDVYIDIKKSCVLYNKETKNIVLVCEATKEISLREVRKSLVNYLPKYMLPTKLLELEKIPLNPNGKIDRKKVYEELIGGLL